MTTIRATEIKQRLGRYLDRALREPILIEKSGRPSVMLISVVEYERLTHIEDQALAHKIKKSQTHGFLGIKGTQKFLARFQSKPNEA